MLVLSGKIIVCYADGGSVEGPDVVDPPQRSDHLGGWEDARRVMLAIRKSADVAMDAALFQSEFSSFDGDGMPGTVEEFKVEVPAAKEECFFQWLKVDTQLQTSFQVLRGADRNLDFTLRDPTGVIVKILPWTKWGLIEATIKREGVYALCLGNNMSKFSRKLVHVFFQTQMADEIRNYTQAIEDYETEILDMSKLVRSFRTRMSRVRVTQTMLRMISTRDQYSVERLKATVQHRSLAIGAVIVAASIFQVVLFRRLFRERHLTASDKPRA